jgi:predicted O-linked N-acetylglucosamine transferase (SPINDLY family)
MLEAEALYRQVLAEQPNHPGTIHMIALLALELGRPDAAITLLERAVKIDPQSPDFSTDLAKALRAAGRSEEAVNAYQQALRMRPTDPATLNNLGNVLLDLRRIPEAIDSFAKAISLKSDFAEAVNNLGNALIKCGRIDDAITAYRDAIHLRPDLAEAHANLAGALKEVGQLDEALACYERAEAIKPDSRIAGARLYSLHLHPDYDPRRILEEHFRWNEKYAHYPLSLRKRAAVRAFGSAPFLPPRPNPLAEGEGEKGGLLRGEVAMRRVRLGYVSGDFNDHPVGRFLLPLLAHHDRERFEIFCYSDARRQDATTARLRAAASQWRVTLSHSDEQLAELVRQDRIDILVDLTMHASGSRLLAFARKPALTQITYLAYCSTTGLQTMDYRLTDPYLDPPGTDGFYSERSIRLPSTYWCYTPPNEALQVAPSRSEGAITFGCFNNFAKVSSSTLGAWRDILTRVPNSRLVMHSPQGQHRRRLVDSFAQAGVAPDQIEFVDRTPLAEYFSRYNRIDIALDPFPFSGATTTCDALWMGVPIVTLSGQTAVGRSGLSILSNIGLPDLAAKSIDEYVSTAVNLALDQAKRNELRRTLRRRMLASPLMDAPRFARDIEAAFLQMP